ncbi:acyl-ACP--UDP-N-acetylglucosamine O-acyltransferase [Pseudooceanicola aestuarii]|uniref:acyl-ACP--UDP-N-acetylglucosamine O-acyltransferase n=1 Tax=Pseudooceanicola aestuarii TaxID=2697319 RepID=UPI0013D2E3C1|nr:acyl-ACP--UDP-N-acetylglucosamine O-acyltransferase [Pseudooceanicola aestuarii]
MTDAHDADAISPRAEIHSHALVEPGAQIAAGARIGPFCHIGPKAVIGPRVELMSHVVVQGVTEIGEDTLIHPFAVIGGIPQDLKFKGEETRLVIGARNRIREHVTMNAGTDGGGGVTRVGDDCLFMAGCHVAHDCQVGNHVVIVNNSALAGHCVIEDEVIVGGLSGVHQFVRIGRGAIIGAVTMVTNDVIPHGLVAAPRGALDGLNLVGLKRRGVARADITALRAAFQMLAQGEGAFQDRARRLGEETESEYVREIVTFVTGASDRSFLTPGGKAGGT